MQRLTPLRAVCDDAGFVSAPWHKEMKPFEIPSSLAYAFAQLLAACGFKVDKESHTWLTCDTSHVSRFIGPPNLTDRANKLTSLTYFANGKKRKPLTKKEMENVIPDEWLTHSPRGEVRDQEYIRAAHERHRLIIHSRFESSRGRME